MKGVSPSNQATDSNIAADTVVALTSEQPQNSSGKPPMTFQERIAMERQQAKGQEIIL